MNIQDLTLTSLETITAFDVASSAYLFTLDELQNAKLDQSEDKQDITGKGGRKLSSLKKNKAVKISGTNGMVSGGLLSVQTGGTIERKTTTVLWADYLTVKSNTATTNYKAFGGLGNEIQTIYVKNADYTIGEILTQAAEVNVENKTFTYNPETKTITLPALESIKDGTEIIAYYDRKITADVLVNESDVYSKKATLYIDAFAEDKCNNIYRVQFFIPKADFSGTFSIDMGENQTVHAFEAEALAGACGTSGQLWTATIFGSDTKDVA